MRELSRVEGATAWNIDCELYGSKYEGEFRDAFHDGQGTMTRPDGSKYEGAFRDGFFLGKGWKGR